MRSFHLAACIALMTVLISAETRGESALGIADADITAAYQERLRRYDAEILEHSGDIQPVLARCLYIDQFSYTEDFTIESAEVDKERCLLSLTRTFPFHPELILYQLEDRWDEEAIDDALRAREIRRLNPTQKARLEQTLARLYRHHDQSDEARRHAFGAFDPDATFQPDLNTRLDAARYLHDQDRTPEAVRLVLARHEDDATGWNLAQRIELLLSIRASTEAIALYDTLKHGKDLSYGHLDMAKAFARAKDPQRARAELRKLKDEGYRSREIAQYNLDFEMEWGTGKSGLVAYEGLRDFGYWQDPLLIKRLTLVGKDALLPWKLRDGLGLVTLLLVLLAVLSIISVPGWISNWLQLRRHFRQAGATWWDSDADAVPFRFSGTATEYFRIWVVNTFLTLATLGIYSAWAKVRKQRYLYRSTTLRGSPFGFHANPIGILKGRLIAVPLLLAYLIGGYFFPGFELVVLGLFLLAFPWLLVRSRLFNLTNTSYRNIRFGFNTDYRDAFKTILGWTVLALVTVGGLYPGANYRIGQFVINHSRYGREAFTMRGSITPFYGYYLAALAILVIGVSLVIGAYAAIEIAPLFEDGLDAAAEGTAIAAITFMVLVIYLACYTFVDVRTTNYLLNHTEVAGGRLYSRLRASQMFAIYTTNLLAIIISFGLLTPWTTIRLARYRLTNMAVGKGVNLEGIEAVPARTASATGEEIGDAFDLQLGL